MNTRLQHKLQTNYPDYNEKRLENQFKKDRHTDRELKDTDNTPLHI